MLGAVASNGVTIFAGVTDTEASIASAGTAATIEPPTPDEVQGRPAGALARVPRAMRAAVSRVRRRRRCNHAQHGAAAGDAAAERRSRRACAAKRATRQECPREHRERQARTAVRGKCRHAPGGCAARRIPKGSRVVQPPGATHGLPARTCHGLATEEASSRPETLPAGTRTAAEGEGCRLTVRNEQGRRAGSSEKHPHGASRREAARRVRMFRARPGPPPRPGLSNAACLSSTGAGCGRVEAYGCRERRCASRRGCREPGAAMASGGGRNDRSLPASPARSAPPRPCSRLPRKRPHSAPVLTTIRSRQPGTPSAARQRARREAREFRCCSATAVRNRKRAAPPPERRCGPRCAAVRLRPSSPGCRGRAPCRRGSR